MDLKTDSPTEEQRRVIFAALVTLQDKGTDVARSRIQVARRFGQGYAAIDLGQGGVFGYGVAPFLLGSHTWDCLWSNG